MMIDSDDGFITVSHLPPIWQTIDHLTKLFDSRPLGTSVTWISQKAVWKVGIYYGGQPHHFEYDPGNTTMFELESWACEIKLRYS